MQENNVSISEVVSAIQNVENLKITFQTNPHLQRELDGVLVTLKLQLEKLKKG